MKFESFIFKKYSFDEATQTLELHYGFDNDLAFCETYQFDFSSGHTANQEALNRACQMLFFLAGVSYYKAYSSERIRIEMGAVDKTTSDFLSKTYQQGLGEFFFVNDLDPSIEIQFPINAENVKPIDFADSSGLLIGIGGGKDSLVSVELLRSQPKVATWSVGHRAQLEPLIKQVELEHYWVERTIDPLLIKHNSQGALNGHIPISAILGAVGTVIAVLTGYRDVVVSNENSANEATLEYRGLAINHQYSKSSAYEQSYQRLLRHNYGDSLRYYSFLRPFSEIRIAEIFSAIGFEKYKSVFSSCNRAFVQSSNDMSWCGECAKCSFTFLALTPFIERPELEKLFRGKNLLLDPSLHSTYLKLLGIAGEKPMDCVGEVKESRQAMNLSKKIYPVLEKKYSYDIPSGYSYESLSSHLMPEKIYSVLKSTLSGD